MRPHLLRGVPRADAVGAAGERALVADVPQLPRETQRRAPEGAGCAPEGTRCPAGDELRRAQRHPPNVGDRRRTIILRWRCDWLTAHVI